MASQQYHRKKRRRQQILMQRRMLLVSILALIILLIVIALIETHKKKTADVEDVPFISDEEQNLSGDSLTSENTEGMTDNTNTMQTDGDFTVVIDAGHGGKDEGTAYDNVKEKDIVLDMALKVQQELEARGIHVVMTRDDDTFIYLNRRVEAAELSDADLYVSIHIDSYISDTSVYGMTIHHQEGKGDGQELAEALQSAYKEADIERVRDIKASDLYVLANTTMPAVLVEAGYITNDDDRSKLQQDTFQQEFAETLATGICNYLEIN